MGILNYIHDVSSGEPVFKKSDLRFFSVIPDLKEGESFTVLIKVAYSVKPEFIREGKTGTFWFIPLKCGTQSQLRKIEDIMGQRVMCNYSEIKRHLMSGVMFNSESLVLENLPVKGEEVICNFKKENGTLTCNSITLLPRTLLSNYQLKSFKNAAEFINSLSKEKEN